MSNYKLNTVKIGEFVVFGRNIFTPPFKGKDELKDEARIVFIVKGKDTVCFPDGKRTFTSGDVFIMKCDKFTSEWSPNDDGSESILMAMQIKQELLEKIYDGKPPVAFKNTEPIQSKAVEIVEGSEMLKAYQDSLLQYLDKPNLINEDIAALKIKELISILIQSDKTGGIKTMLSDLFKVNNYEFREVINTHMYENVNLEDLAFFTGLSLSSFKRKFKAIYGDSPKHFINKMRLEKAAQMLAGTDLRVSEIAYDCGFNDVAYFTKVFGNAYQISPSEYRKSL